MVDALVVAAWLSVAVDNLRAARRDRAARAHLGVPVVSRRHPGKAVRILVIVLLSTGAAALEHLTGGAVTMSRVVTGCGLMLVVAGTALHVIARRHLGVQWTSEVTVLERQALVTTGPYAVVRHPLYLAASLMAVGTVLAHPSAATLCLAVGFLGGVALKIRAEDHALRTAFDARHDDYAARVPAIVPRLRDLWTATRPGLRTRSRG